MGETLAIGGNPSDIALLAIRELTNMEIPPLPPYYQVWYSHLERKNDALSSEIEQNMQAHRAIDESFLRDMHKKFFDGARAAATLEKYAAKMVKETKSLQRLATNFGSSTEEFQNNLGDASTQFEEGEVSDDYARAIIATLAKATEKAIERNKELETNLTRATSEISTLQNEIEAIATDANTDFLTKLSNRRFFDNMAPHLIAAAQAQGEPLSVVITDIDHFKKFNDKWGHHVGDQVLKLVAEVLRENIKGQDLLARYGGEEFAIALPNTAAVGAAAVADNIRVAIAKRRLINRANDLDLGRVTMSFGVAALQDGEELGDVLARADKALYAAKDGGRNRVERAE